LAHRGDEGRGYLR